MKEKFLTIILLLLLALFGVCFVYSKLSEKKDIQKYSTALIEYKNDNYATAYKHFGKISMFSDLKPPAMFRRARCATLLGDINAAKKNYKTLLFRYPKSQLYVVSEYNLATILYEQGQRSAKKHFLHIIKKYPKTDYSLAAEFYIASIDMKNAEKSKLYLKRKHLKQKSLKHFIKYVELSPDGRFAQQSIDNIEKLGIVITPDNNFSIAESYNKRELYKEASNYYAKSPLTKSWAKYAQNEFKLNKNNYAAKIVEKGLLLDQSNINTQDAYSAIDLYINCFEDKNKIINILINNYPQNNYMDYFLFLKANYSNGDSQYEIYEQLYNNYPNSHFSAEAMYKVFLSKINKNNFDEAILIGQKHISLFKKSDTAPAIFFWMGKIYEYKNNFSIAKSYYKTVISKYPDSYYSYRAYCKLHNDKGGIIVQNFKIKPIIFPIKNKHARDMATKLIEIGDYDFVAELYKDNKFVQSWIEYKQGKKVESIITAQNAMQDIYPKPKFNDVRWRLVYPLNYYEDINVNSIDDSLIILSIIREESHFNTNIVSPVGAVGLMQLMPATAEEIASQYGYKNDLYNPQNNIRLGSLYYLAIRSSLWGKDIYAILSYNGGKANVLNWIKTINYRDIDDFVEKIPYFETQTYVKKVLKSYWAYTNIYN